MKVGEDPRIKRWLVTIGKNLNIHPHDEEDADFVVALIAKTILQQDNILSEYCRLNMDPAGLRAKIQDVEAREAAVNARAVELEEHYRKQEWRRREEHAAAVMEADNIALNNMDCRFAEQERRSAAKIKELKDELRQAYANVRESIVQSTHLERQLRKVKTALKFKPAPLKPTYSPRHIPIELL